MRTSWWLSGDLEVTEGASEDQLSAAPEGAKLCGVRVMARNRGVAPAVRWVVGFAAR